MPLAACPPPADLQRLLLGGLPDLEVDVLEHHVLHCGVCLATMRLLFDGRDPLTGVLRKDGSCDAFASRPVVVDLMKQLKSLRPESASSPKGAPMIAFSCSSCQKRLSVKEDFAGKKAKCPGCGRVVVVPAAVAAASAREEWPTVAPSPVQRPHPGQPDASNAPTHPPSNNPDLTHGANKADADHDSSLTDFLAPSQAADELGRLGKYRILKILGHGGMGVVFKAEDPKLKRSVAIKAMLPVLAASASAGKRFLREAQAMAAVKHDHIATIYQVDEESGVPFLAMEFLAGEPLDERLKRDGKLPLADVLRIGREMAEGLEAAHATGLIHRDVKPANIWLETPRNRVKILDFGLARAVSEDAGLTQQGAIVGTPAYMAPEQGRGEPVDARCDLFSLGVVLYRLCTGHPPFTGKDTVSTLMAVALEQPAPPRQMNAEVPQELSDLVMTLLEKDAALRPAAAGVVVEMLQSLEKKRARAQESEDQTLAPSAAAAKRAAVPGKQGVSAESSRTPTMPRGRALSLVAAAAGALALVAAGIVLFWQTPSGAVRIEINDADIQVAFDNKDLIFKGVEKQNLKVSPGAHGLHVKRGDLEFDTDKPILVKKGETVALKIEWFKDGKLQVVQGDKVIGAKSLAKIAPLDSGWLKQVAAMPAEKQVKAVAEKLKERNPGFDGKVTHKIEAGVVTELQFVTDKITDISPVRALAGLQVLHCGGTYDKNSQPQGRLADLSPLKDMKLTKLYCAGTQVSDLSPLKDMKLTELQCHYTRVSDLSPLKGMMLTMLHCSRTRVSDLSPLKDMKLTKLYCAGTQVSDLSPLKNMMLTEVNCGNTKVIDLSPLKAMKLKELHCGGTKVSDLSPLKAMKLTTLHCNNTRVTDLSPLKDMMLTELHCGNSRVSDLSPLKDMMLTRLLCYNTQVSDLSPLKNMKLTYLSCAGTQVSDLSPLKDMKLTGLHCGGTQVSDLSALRGMPLKDLRCDFKPERDAEILRSIKTLETINEKPAEDFWKEVDAQRAAFDAWLKQVPAMPAVQQVKAVADKLKERNPGFDGKETHKIEAGVVTELQFLTDNVTDISPVRALTELRTLNCSGTWGNKKGRGPLADLSPLKGMKLTNLSCNGSQVSDLSPLKDMKLTYLDCGFTSVSDLSPLKGMPLYTLQLYNTKVSDLSPLKGMPLTYLDCTVTEVFRLTPLKDMKLTKLVFGYTNVSDLSPLKDMKLTTLWCNATKVSDLSPLKGMPLKDLRCDFKPGRDAEILRSINTLETINQKTAKEFWQAVDAKRLDKKP